MLLWLVFCDTSFYKVLSLLLEVMMFVVVELREGERRIDQFARLVMQEAGAPLALSAIAAAAGVSASVAANTIRRHRWVKTADGRWHPPGFDWGGRDIQVYLSPTEWGLVKRLRRGGEQ